MVDPRKNPLQCQTILIILNTMKTKSIGYGIEAVVSVDGRGQLVLPKDVRELLGIEAGGKLAVVVKTSGGVPCCVNLVPVAALSDGVRAVVDPVSEEDES